MLVPSLHIPGYQVVEVLHRSARTTVARSIRSRDGSRVVLKVCTDEEAGPATKARLRREARVLHEVRGEGVVRLLEDRTRQARPMLVLADRGGRALREVAGGRPLEIDLFLDVALRVASTLGRVHRCGYLHGALDASNVLMAPSGTVEILDFGRASRIGEAPPPPDKPGPLASLSPEQAGRTGPVDQRADLYSLGATLYEMLTGAPSITFSDPLEAVHARLAGLPEPPQSVVPAIPPGLSDVVMRLLAKVPGDRYQSCEGVLHDLEVCRRTLRAGEPLEPFPLGWGDVPRGLRVPPGLYGRTREASRLDAAFERVGKGGVAVCLVHGPGGVGKSSLVQDLERRLGPRATWLAGEGDRLDRTRPYAALVKALHQEVQRVLTRPSEAVQAWSDGLRGATGDLAGLLVERVPALERLLGNLPPPPPLPPVEAANRLDRLMVRAIQAFSGPGRPLVLFLDDLQWADLGTLRVLEALAAASEGPPLLAVASWNSEQAEAPMEATVERLRGAAVRPTEIPLENLDVDAVGAVLADTLHWPVGEAAPLARLVARKTGGNPFFLRQFLTTLAERGLFRFDPATRRWLCDRQEVEAAEITDNVARVLENRLEELPARTRELLQAAACLGARFPLEPVAEVAGLSPPEVAEGLAPALERGILAPCDPSENRLRFPHDRIHSAVLASLSPHESSRLHLAFGRALAPRARLDPSREVLLEAVGHLNRGLPGVGEEDERLEGARLDLLAGQCALQEGAFDTALECLEAGLDLAGGPGAWERDPELARDLHLLGASAADLVARKGSHGVAALPPCEDPSQRLAMRLLDQAVACAFQAGRTELAVRLSLALVERSLRYGAGPETCTAFAYLAVVLAVHLGRISQGLRVGDLALRLAEDQGRSGTAVRTRFLVHHMVRHWVTPLAPLVGLTAEMYRACLEGGDFEFAQIVASAWCQCSFQAGVDLPTFRRRLDRMESAVRSLTRGRAPLQWDVSRRLVEALMEPPGSGFRPGPADRLADVQARAEADGQSLAACFAARDQALLHLLHDDLPEAARCVDDWERLLPAVQGTPEIPYFHYFASVVRLAALPEVPTQARRLAARVRASRARLSRWERLCPVARTHWGHLVAAEAARAAGDALRAWEAYDAAIAAARENGFPMDEALALERAARLYLERGRQRQARLYMDDACRAWRWWGAEARVAWLEARFPDLLDPSEAESQGFLLDTASVIKAAQAVSGEIRWEWLVPRLLEVAMENAGAQRSALLVEREGAWFVEARSRAERPGEVEVFSLPLAHAEDLAASVVRYAIRTGEMVVLDDASSDPTFAEDPYIWRVRPRSVLALPIGSRGSGASLLYLENGLAPGVFTRERAEVLRLLSAHMAISLENARNLKQIQEERERRHEEEVRSAALEARKNGLAAYLGIASHDLKSPLAAIEMWAEQLGAGRIDARRARAHIGAACRRATGLVRTYLDAVAVETGGHVSLNRRKVNLARLVEEEIDFLLSRFLPEERARLALEWNLQPLTLEADGERLQQVVGNLVGNAVDICPVGTRIGVTLRREEPWARLVIEDEGPGIPAGVRDRLFAPFESARQSGSSTGLGLWICRVLVEAHGGRLRLDDACGTTRFVLDLPLDPVGRSDEDLAGRPEWLANGGANQPS